MESRAKLLGHPIHPMLITVPLGLLPASVLLDVVYLIKREGKWAEFSRWLILGGVLGGLAAAIFGWRDYLAIPSGTRAKRIGLLHGVGNVIVMALFSLSWLLRRNDSEEAPPSAIVLSCIGLALGMATAWLGGELIDRLGVGVDDGAHLNSPNALTGLHASHSVKP